MKRRFNVTGSCNPQRHYMVRLDERLKKIKEKYVDYGSYFVINKGRQYGKTTTLAALENYLKDDYIVLSIDFQQIGTEDFVDAATFYGLGTEKICRIFYGNLQWEGRKIYRNVWTQIFPALFKADH